MKIIFKNIEINLFQIQLSSFILFYFFILLLFSYSLIAISLFFYLVLGYLADDADI